MVSRVLIFLFFISNVVGQISVRNIEFIGNTTFKRSQLIGLIKLKEDEAFKQYLLNSDRSSIINFYRSNGFNDVSVTINDAFIENSFSEKDIRFQITENFRHSFGEIAITGNKDVSLDIILEMSKIKEAEFYQPEKVNEWRVSLLQYYQEHGKPSIEVFISTDIDVASGYRVNLFVDIREGKTVHIRTIYIRPSDDVNLRTDYAMIRKEFEFKTGDLFKYSDLENTRRYLFKTGLFQNVQIRPNRSTLTHHGDIDSVDVDVVLSEKKSVYLGAALGLANGYQYSFEGNEDLSTTLEVEFGKRNIEGKGIDFTFTGLGDFFWRDWTPILRSRDARAQARFLNFPFHRWKSVVGFSVIQFTELISKKEVILDRILMNYSAKYEFSDNESIDMFYGMDFNTDSINIGKEIKTKLGLSDYDTYSFSVSYKKDKRNNFIYPTKGFLLGGSVKTSRSIKKESGVVNERKTTLNTNIDYLTLESEFRYFYALGVDVSFGFNLKLGAILSQDPAKEIPSLERFRSAEMIRGFQINAIGPYSKLENTYSSIGGNYLVANNYEVRYKIYEYIYGQAFLDMGNIWSEIDEMNLSSIHVSTGIGISLNTNFIAARLEYGWKLTRRGFIVDGRYSKEPQEAKETGAFSFGLSYHF